MQKRLLLLTLLISNLVHSQLYVGGSIGVAGYDGDLNAVAFKRMKLNVSGTLSYGITNRFNARLGLLLGSIEGGDQWSGTTLLKQIRNLSFKTEITELSLVGELQAFDLNKKSWTPYIFGGVALFHFNPYIIGDSSKKIFLKPLSTEGQGLSEYPGRKPYSLTQLSFPFGGGIKVVASDNIIVGIEFGLRRTLTDYLDDVSTEYVDETTLFQKKGSWLHVMLIVVMKCWGRYRAILIMAILQTDYKEAVQNIKTGITLVEFT